LGDLGRPRRTARYASINDAKPVPVTTTGPGVASLLARSKISRPADHDDRNPQLPGSLALLTTGLLGLTVTRRRRTG
jgi:hypothetical protein